MKKVYIAVMITGEYEDRRETNIAAFTDRLNADLFSERTNANLSAVGLHRDEDVEHVHSNVRPWLSESGALVPAHSSDAFRIDYTGASVYIDSVTMF
jgi:hypothetical protein